LNEQESLAFIEELTIAFPGFRTAAKDSPDMERTFKAWSASWVDLTIEECRRALKSLLLKAEISWEHYRTPGPFIRQLVISQRGGTSEADRVNEQNRFGRWNQRRDYTGSPMSKALAEAMKLHEEGKSREEIYAAIDAALPPAPPAYSQPRYACHACLDRGLVRVFRSDYAAAVANERVPIESITEAHTYLVACSCEAGEEKNRVKNPLPVYNRSNFCVFRDQGIEKERQELADWLARRRPENYHSEFESWAR
jgi:hypothetical protein